MRRIIIITITTVSLLALAACGGGSDIETTPVEDDTSSDATNPAAGEALPDPEEETTTTADTSPAGVGDTISLEAQYTDDQADVTLVQFLDPAAPGDEYQSVPDGQRAVAVQLRITNTGDDALAEYPDISTKVIDTDGQSFGPTYYVVADCPAFTGEAALTPGDSAMGCVSVAVPADATVAKIQYGLGGAADAIGQWEIAA